MQTRVAMAQINTTVGDLEGNSQLIKTSIADAAKAKAGLVVFPEMSITGYPPLDLLPPREVLPPNGDRSPEREEFVRLNKECLNGICAVTKGITAVIGFVDYDEAHLYNSAAIVTDGHVISTVHKSLLPTYDVFDEQRYFTPAETNSPQRIPLGGTEILLGALVCEDIWDERMGYPVRIADQLCAQGAQMIVTINASPFHDKIRDVRLHILKEKARRLRIPIFYVNMVGGQDELVFDGQSLAVDSAARLIGIGKQFEEDLVFVDLDLQGGTGLEQEAPSYNREAEMFGALVLGVRDYFRKTGFKRAYVGLSGGIDSSLVAAIAVEALGATNVTGVSMPSRYSSDHSKEDARSLANNLHMGFITIPIETVFATFEKELEPHFQGRAPNVAEENLQSRIRGNVLMTLSNKFDALVLATGNKTELALGYATLYGDMSGGLEVIGDVSKTEVYSLARYYNTMICAVIPENCFTKIPSAELRPGQFDPFDYSVISPLVDDIIENRLSKQELIKRGYETTLVEETYHRIRRAEYKRHQAAPSIKITKKAFGLGWKMPIVNKFSY